MFLVLTARPGSSTAPRSASEGPPPGRKDRERFISGKYKQNAVESMVVTDAEGRLLFCSPAEPASCVDITHARQLGLVRLLADGHAVEISCRWRDLTHDPFVLNAITGSSDFGRLLFDRGWCARLCL